MASRAEHRRLRRETVIAIAFVGMALILTVAVWVLGHSGKAELSVPALGAASAQSLPDGRPVFVVRHSDNTISVFDAFSTHVPSGVYKLVAWCPQQRLFTDLVHGATYGEWGSHVNGPGRDGMTVDDWRESGSGIDVIGTLGPAEEAPDRAGPLPWSICHFVMHEFDAAQAFAPAAALMQPQRQWILVEGGLDLARGRLCRLPLSANCTKEFAPVRGVVDSSGDGSWASFVSADWLWLAWNSGDALEHLTLAQPVSSP